MRKHLGSGYAAILTPFFIVFPIVFAIIALSSEISAATVFLSVLCVSCCVLWGHFFWKRRNILYAWGTFRENDVYVKMLFDKSFSLSYDKCRSCGIAFYRHTFLNVRKSALGSELFYIFLSVDFFDEKYRNQINLWAPSKSRIKVRFSRDLFDYLLARLPQKQADMLKRDFEKYYPGARRTEDNKDGIEDGSMR
jgi:hypothetical protein